MKSSAYVLLAVLGMTGCASKPMPDGKIVMNSPTRSYAIRLPPYEQLHDGDCFQLRDGGGRTFIVTKINCPTDARYELPGNTPLLDLPNGSIPQYNKAGQLVWMAPVKPVPPAHLEHRPEMQP